MHVFLYPVLPALRITESHSPHPFIAGLHRKTYKDKDKLIGTHTPAEKLTLRIGITCMFLDWGMFLYPTVQKKKPKTWTKFILTQGEHAKLTQKELRAKSKPATLQYMLYSCITKTSVVKSILWSYEVFYQSVHVNSAKMSSLTSCFKKPYVYLC